ncbi:hypothetical protein BDZ91DRAFT_723693, partial [Kalaharituber pfeilii]
MIHCVTKIFGKQTTFFVFLFIFCIFIVSKVGHEVRGRGIAYRSVQLFIEKLTKDKEGNNELATTFEPPQSPSPLPLPPPPPPQTNSRTIYISSQSPPFILPFPFSPPPFFSFDFLFFCSFPTFLH